MFARDVANTYTKEVEKYKNVRGGRFQAGLYPVSANVPLGAQTGATPDGRLAFTPIADGIGPMSGRDVKGPTATANSVAKLEQGVASNGTLLNQKFHPSALAGMEGLTKFVALIRSYFDQKGMHMQFNVVTRETLIDAQQHPEKIQDARRPRRGLQRVVHHAFPLVAGRHHQPYPTGLLTEKTQMTALGRASGISGGFPRPSRKLAESLRLYRTGNMS